MSGSLEKFGRVFISKNTENNNKRSYEQLKFASFSNLDLKWYDLSGDTHSQFAHFKGNKFWMAVDIVNTNRDGNREQFHGQFLMPLGLGEGEVVIDTKYLENAKRMERDLAIQLELLDADDEDELRNFDKSRCILAFLCPQAKLYHQSPILAYLSMLVMMDDLLDGGNINSDTNDMAEKLKKLRYTDLTRYQTANMMALKCENVERGMWAEISSSSVLGISGLGFHSVLQLQHYYAAGVEICKGLREAALQLVVSEQDTEPFFTAMEELYEVSALETCNEWNFGRDNCLLQPAQDDLFKITSGTGVTCEAIALQLGIRLKPEIRRSFLFKWFCDQVACHGRKVNDFMSYHNEMVTGRAKNNEVYLLHVKQRMSLADALRKVNDDANLCVKRVMEAGRVLVKMFDNDQDLKKYVEMVKGMMGGLLQSCGFVQRYHVSLTFDCYVDLDEK